MPVSYTHLAPNYHDALLKGLIGAGYTFKTPGPASCCIFTVKDSDKPEFVDIAWKLKSMGYKLYGTSGTCAWLNKHMVPCNEVRPMSGESPNIVDLLQSGLVDYCLLYTSHGVQRDAPETEKAVRVRFCRGFVVSFFCEVSFSLCGEKFFFAPLWGDVYKRQRSSRPRA